MADLLGSGLTHRYLDAEDEEGGGVGADLVGAAKAIIRAAEGGGSRLPRWRRRAAPGVPEHGYGVFPVPLKPDVPTGIFDSTVTQITYSKIVQIPFQGLRLLTRVSRSGLTNAINGIQVFARNGIFIGIHPQQGVLGDLNLENYTNQSFDVGLSMQPAEQGAEITVNAFVNPTPSGTETLQLSIEILGKVAR